MMSDGILSFENIFKSLTEHLWAGIVAFILIILWTQRESLSNGFKDYLKMRVVSLDNNTIELAKINDRYFSLYENGMKNMERISDAIVTIKEYMVGMEGRIVERVNNKIDSELSSIKTTINDDRLEKIIVMVNRHSNPSYNSLERESKEFYSWEAGNKNDSKNQLTGGKTVEPNIRSTIRPE